MRSPIVYRAQRLDAGDVDQQRRPRQPQIEHREQRLSAGKDLRHGVVALQRGERLAEVARAHIIECRCLHGSVSAAARACRRCDARSIAASMRRGVQRRLRQLDAQAAQGVVDRIEQHRRWRDGAAFAHALHPERRVRRQRLGMMDAEFRHLRRPWQQVVHEGRGKRLAVGVVGAFLVERGADALRGSAGGLAVHHHRIDHAAAILGDHVIENFNGAEVRIDRHHRGVRSVAEGAGVDPRLVSERRFQPVDIDIRRKKLRPPVPGFRNLLEGDR